MLEESGGRDCFDGIDWTANFKVFPGAFGSGGFELIDELGKACLFPEKIAAVRKGKRDPSFSGEEAIDLHENGESNDGLVSRDADGEGLIAVSVEEDL